MFTRARRGYPEKTLSDNRFEGSQAFMTRERRILILRAGIVGIEKRMDGFSSSAVMDDIVAMNIEDQETPIYLLINSIGGTVDEGQLLYDMIKLSIAPIITIAQNVQSMATIIAASGTKRLAFPHSQFMLHLPEAVLIGDSTEIENQNKMVQRLKDELINCYIDSGVTAGLLGRKGGGSPPRALIKKQILKDIDKQYWIDVKRAKQYGLVDDIIKPQDLFGKKGVGFVEFE